MNLGKAIKDLRKEQSLRQQEFAILCGVSQPYTI